MLIIVLTIVIIGGIFLYCLNDKINSDVNYLSELEKINNSIKQIKMLDEKLRTLIPTYYRDKNGKLHRTDGPAIEYIDGPSRWYYHGERINVTSQKEFERALKLKGFW